MEPLHLKSEAEVYAYMKHFLATRAKAVQLDGSTQHTQKGGVVIVFEYSVDGQKYKLLGHLTRKAMKHFIELTEQQGSPALALREHGHGLILADSKNAGGWHCEHYVAKTSDRLKKAA
jgi:hypothetical protein